MPPKKRERGHVRKRGNSYQVMVYAGPDPVTGKDLYLYGSTTDEDKVDAIKARLQAKVDRQRNAATKATLEYALHEWLEVHEADEPRWTDIASSSTGPSPRPSEMCHLEAGDPRIGEVLRPAKAMSYPMQRQAAHRPQGGRRARLPNSRVWCTSR
jgi:hypothetical protein